MERNKEKEFKEELKQKMLLKRGRTYHLSGGGTLLLWFKYLKGSWKKLEDDVKKKKHKGQLEEIKQFRKQERLYGIRVEPKGNIKGMDIKAIEWCFVEKGV
ncbi:hypothetical protein LCGC14_0884680 [marine sediment metagenome]|uniref:Uncharacterized protein n=1 Tax=marine sediment metagenome TaxID=412755 RepID=A0A0F9RKE5_9ZZZZ